MKEKLSDMMDDIFESSGSVCKYPREAELWGHKGIAVEDGIYKVIEPFEIQLDGSDDIYDGSCFGVGLIAVNCYRKKCGNKSFLFGTVTHFTLTSRKWGCVSNYLDAIKDGTKHSFTTMHRDEDIESEMAVGWIE